MWQIILVSYIHARINMQHKDLVFVYTENDQFGSQTGPHRGQGETKERQATSEVYLHTCPPKS